MLLEEAVSCQGIHLIGSNDYAFDSGISRYIDFDFRQSTIMTEVSQISNNCCRSQMN